MTATAQTGAKRPGPPLWVSIVLAGAGLVLAIVCAAEAIVPLVQQLAQVAPIDTPGTYRMHLHRGQYGVYELTGSSDSSGSSGGFGFTPSGSITARSVRVTGVDGTNVAVNNLVRSSRPTINHDTDVYTEAVAFRVPSSGDYDITIDSVDQSSVIVRRSVSDVLRDVRGWFVGALTSGLAVLVGVVLLIVTLVRRSGTSTRGGAVGAAGPPGYARAPVPAGWPPTGPFTGPAPGWYADPAAPYRRRYWDGRQWTQHVS